MSFSNFRLLLGALTILCISCNKETETAISAEDYIAQNNIIAEQTPEGLYYVINTVGDNRRPDTASIISFHYEAILPSGKVFETSFSQPTSFTSLISELIQAVQIGAKLVGKGGKITLFVPPHLGYGTDPGSNSPIPKNSMFIFKLTLVDFTDNYSNLLQSDDGVFVQLESEGGLDKAVSGRTVVMDYNGFLTNNVKFDSSYDRGMPLETAVSGLVPGMQIGLSILGAEGKAKIIIPPNLGYGATQSGNIPGNSILIFDVVVREVK